MTGTEVASQTGCCAWHCPTQTLLALVSPSFSGSVAPSPVAETQDGQEPVPEVAQRATPKEGQWGANVEAWRLCMRQGGAAADEVESLISSLAVKLRVALRDGAPAPAPFPCTPPLLSLYKLGKQLGRGHFGVVRACQELATGELFACKSILKSSIRVPEDVDELEAEVLCMTRLQASRHEGVAPAASRCGTCSSTSTSSKGRSRHTVTLHEVLVDDEAVHLILDHCAGGDLFDHISRRRSLSEKECAQILCQLLEAVGDMHSRGVMHRDLKPENVLLTKKQKAFSGFCSAEEAAVPQVKVADFGLSAFMNGRCQAWGVAGSPYYVAPEVLTRDCYGPEADVWSLGVLLYKCLTGFLPFALLPSSPADQMHAVLQQQPKWDRKVLQSVSPQCMHLLRRMMEPDPTHRISVKQALDHPWLLHFCPQPGLQAEVWSGEVEDEAGGRLRSCVGLWGPPSPVRTVLPPLHRRSSSEDVGCGTGQGGWRGPLLALQRKASI